MVVAGWVDVPEIRLFPKYGPRESPRRNALEPKGEMIDACSDRRTGARGLCAGPRRESSPRRPKGTDDSWQDRHTATAPLEIGVPGSDRCYYCL